MLWGNALVSLNLKGFAMWVFKQAATAFIIALGAAAMPAISASSATSSIYDSITTLVGSASNSLNRSSNGSSNGGRVASGEYKLLEVAVSNDQPGVVHLKMQAVAGQVGATGTGELVLSLPQAAFETSGLVAGDVIAARTRAYGMEFANGKTQAAFFLVLNDDTYRELASNPVVL
jgi:hypothetical protein